MENMGPFEGPKINEQTAQQQALLKKVVSILFDSDLARMVNLLVSACESRQELLNLVLPALNDPSPANIQKLREQSVPVLSLLAAETTKDMKTLPPQSAEQLTLLVNISADCMEIRKEIEKVYKLSIGNE